MPARHPYPRSGIATPGTLRAVGTALHHATAQYRVPSVPRPSAAVPVPNGPSRAAAGSPQPPAHLGAADAPLDGAVRPGASPMPLAHPCEPSAAPPPPPASRAPSSPSRASPVRYTPSGCSPPASLAWRTSSWGVYSTGRRRGRTSDGGCRPCSESPRAWRCQGLRSMRP